LQKSAIDPAAANKKKTDQADDLSLTEIGPRFVLTPIKLFEGSFSGPCLWENKGKSEDDDDRTQEF
jgi:ribosome biogenesis protein BRX1